VWGDCPHAFGVTATPPTAGERQRGRAPMGRSISDDWFEREARSPCGAAILTLRRTKAIELNRRTSAK